MLRRGGFHVRPEVKETCGRDSAGSETHAEQVERLKYLASPVSHTINTYGVERNNLPMRQHSRIGRKVNAFSKDPNYLEHQLTLAFAYYHFVIPHRGLRQRLPRALPAKGRKGSFKKRKLVTPAMAAGFNKPLQDYFTSAAVSRPTRLTKDGVDAWLDKEKLLPGQGFDRLNLPDWELEIRKAVRERV